MDYLTLSNYSLLIPYILTRYSGRGLFLDPPTVFLRHAKWIISMPKIMELYKWDFEVPSKFIF